MDTQLQSHSRGSILEMTKHLQEHYPISWGKESHAYLPDMAVEVGGQSPIKVMQ